MTDHSTLERRLRDAADSSLWDDVSSDAWQQNQSLVAADQARHTGRRLSAIAAAVVAVLVIVGSAWFSRDHISTAPPATGGNRTSVPQVTENQVVHLQGGVELYRMEIRNDLTWRVEIARTAPQSGRPAKVCLLFAEEGKQPTRSESCTKGVAARNDDYMHIDYLGTDAKRGLLWFYGAVDRDVAKLRLWTANGDASELPLKALPGGSGYQGFGFVNTGDFQSPVRLAALAANGELLQTAAINGPDAKPWPVQQSACEDAKRNNFHTGTLPHGTTLAFSHDSVRVSVGSGSPPVCLPLNSLAQVPVGPRTVLVVIPPEAVGVTLRTPTGEHAAPLVTYDANPWRFAVVTPPDGVRFNQVKIVLTDAADNELAAFTTSHTVSTSP
jgi:hypothetical protein